MAKSKIKKFPGIRGLAGLQVVDVYAEGDVDDFPSEDVQEQPYAVEQERMHVGGLGETPEYTPVNYSQRVDADRTCTSKKLPFEYLRFDTCVTPMEGVEALPPITGSRDAVKTIRAATPIANRGREFFIVLCLNARNAPIGITTPHIGGRNFSMVDVGITLQAVVLSGAGSFIVAHNHPSGEALPSPEDIEITKRLFDAAKLLQLNLLDHVILVDDGAYYSLLDHGKMPR